MSVVSYIIHGCFQSRFLFLTRINRFRRHGTFEALKTFQNNSRSRIPWRRHTHRTHATDVPWTSSESTRYCTCQRLNVGPRAIGRVDTVRLLVYINTVKWYNSAALDVRLAEPAVCLLKAAKSNATLQSQQQSLVGRCLLMLQTCWERHFLCVPWYALISFIIHIKKTFWNATIYFVI